MLSPEEISSVDSKAFVVDVVVCRLYERRVLGNHDEQDYRSGEDVYRLAIVFLSQVDFWGHVSHSATMRLKVPRAVSARERGGVSEVSQLEIGVSTKKKILRLEVSVSDTGRVAVVEAYHKLSEVVPGKVFLHSSCLGDDVKKAPTLG